MPQLSCSQSARMRGWMPAPTGFVGLAHLRGCWPIFDRSKHSSEHPTALISNGQAYVTTLVNSVMRSPCWGSTAIFLSWDDWGGFYDHVVPPVIDGNGYGFRVPGHW
jgi:hypothetical protein